MEAIYRTYWTVDAYCKGVDGILLAMRRCKGNDTYSYQRSWSAAGKKTEKRDLQFLHAIFALVSLARRHFFLTVFKVSCQGYAFGGVFAFFADYWM